MKILIIAIPGSLHVARWIEQIKKKEWDIRLFPSTGVAVSDLSKEIRGITCYNIFYGINQYPRQNIKNKGIPVISLQIARILEFFLDRFYPQYRLHHLIWVIKTFKPDIIHSLGIQTAGYLTLSAKQKIKANFPKWIVTNWGSDIYLFGRLKKHRERIKAVLEECDYYSCECQRDIEIAKQYGFKKTTLPVFPNSGGFDLQKIQKLQNRTPTSKRHSIILKGYQHWAGRALVGIHALERCKDLLKEYEIIIHSVLGDDNNDISGVRIAAELLEKSLGIRVTILPNNTPHDLVLAAHASARISIGLSISDAISTSLLEAMAMKSFPIQSWTACANEWVTHNETALLVPPEDPEIIEKAIRRALTDDKFVDKATEVNYRTILQNLDDKIIKQKIINFYQFVFNNKR